MPGTLKIADIDISLPLPLYLLVEDVGWWQGFDGSACGQPYRNAFGRKHCLEDYEALTVMAKALGMRIGLGMVLGEWDRRDRLRDIPGATWLGREWSNAINRGPWLDEAAAYLNNNREHLEIAVHGLCHEFWQEGVMVRSEFHDQDGRMRPADLVRRHLRGYIELLADNGLEDRPRLFVPPALNHSFGNGLESIQAILAEFGIRYVITRFARARRYAPPRHEMMSWEEGVLLLERGEAPVSWQTAAAAPPGSMAGPVLPLHWGNLLHPDPAGNGEVARRWSAAIAQAADTMETVLARDVADCFRQAAACCLGRISAVEDGVEVDLGKVAEELSLSGRVRLKLKGRRRRPLSCLGGAIMTLTENSTGIETIDVVPDPGRNSFQLLVDTL